MKISKLIKELKEWEKEAGDIDCVILTICNSLPEWEPIKNVSYDISKGGDDSLQITN